MAIGNDFDSGQLEMIGDTAYVRIIPKITASRLATTDQGSSPTYHTGTVLRATVTPYFSYGAVELPDHLLSKLGAPESAALEAGYRKQLLAALDEDVDSLCGDLGPSISTVKGPANGDKSLILDMQTSLATNSKNHVVVGQTEVHLKYHPSQIKYIGNIAEFANANTRGDSANPNVKGVILKAWGMTFTETGSIDFSGGFYWNMMFAPLYAILAWNLKPRVKVPQDFELTKRLFGECESGPAEVFDEDAVVWKST
jgi:hypothetical protein